MHARPPRSDEAGLSLIEVVVATALVASGVMALVALFVQSDAALRNAGHRSLAAILASAMMEHLTTEIDQGTRTTTGDEWLDPAGRPVALSGTYRRRWSVSPLGTDPGLLLVQVEVTAHGAGGHAGTTRLRTLRRHLP